MFSGYALHRQTHRQMDGCYQSYYLPSLWSINTPEEPLLSNETIIFMFDIKAIYCKCLVFHLGICVLLDGDVPPIEPTTEELEKFSHDRAEQHKIQV